MKRLIFKYSTELFEMPQGESYVGRSSDCNLQFNDPVVSRKHVRILCTEDGVFIENVSGINSTLINGKEVKGRQKLKDGDKICVGMRNIEVLLAAPMIRPNKKSMVDAPRSLALGSAPHQDVDLSMDTFDTFEPFDRNVFKEETQPGGMSDLSMRNCPRCGGDSSWFETVCFRCQFSWPDNSDKEHLGIPLSASRRSETRFSSHIPVVYSSEYLTLEAKALDLSKGGMFIHSDILDNPGTPCLLTILPKDRGAIQLRAKICYVSDERTPERLPGFGLRFIGLSFEAKEWLKTVCMEEQAEQL